MDDWGGCFHHEGQLKMRQARWEQKMTNEKKPAVEIVPMMDAKVLRLDHMVLVSQALERLGISKIVDERLASHPLHKVSNGRCVEALIFCILTGSHTLYRVKDDLSQYDVELLFRKKPGEQEFTAWQFTDNRLAASLDELYKYGLNKINIVISLMAIKEYAIEMKRLHFDTTSLALFGEYQNSVVSNPQGEDPPPNITFGYSKDHRPDLKQILFGLTISGDGNVPLLGRVTDGNQTDSKENRVNIRRLVAAYPDLTATIIVADSKFFAGPTIELANENKLLFLTLMPETKAKQTAIRYDQKLRDEGNEPALLLEKSNDSGEGKKQWWGRSTIVTHNYQVEAPDPDKEGKFLKEQRSVEVRALIIESSSLREQKQKTLQQQIKYEAGILEKLVNNFAKLSFSCKEDAQQAIENALKIKSKAATDNANKIALENRLDSENEAAANNKLRKQFQFHDVRFKLNRQDHILANAKTGRPKKGEVAKIKTVWKVTVEINVVSDQLLKQWLDKESRFVLAASPSTVETHSELDLLLAYKEQHGIEGCMAWLKGVANIAPIFLEKAERIAALGLIYILALMVNALIQREIRRQLVIQNTQMPGNRGWTDIPTATVLYRLFEGLKVIHYNSPDGPIKLLVGLTTEQARLLTILGNDLLARHDLVIGQINEPHAGQRGYRAPEHRRGRAYKGARNKRKKLSPGSSQ